MDSAGDPKPAAMGYPAPPPCAPAHPNVATAYPYPYPAPPPPPFYRPDTRLFRRLLTVAAAFFLLLAAATLVLWLVLRPRLPEFSLASASVSDFNLSSSRLSASFDLSFTVRNPNKKMSVYYNPILASVIYGGEKIATTHLPPFYQGKQNVTALRATSAVAEEYVGADVAQGIAAERAGGNGAVGFDARLVAWVRFKTGWWTTRRHPMTVYCEGFQMGFGNATAAVGSTVGPPKRCAVNL